MKKKLNLPVFNKPLPRGKRLTIDEYIRWCEEYVRSSRFDREAYERRKRLEAVDVPFRIPPA